MKKIILTAVCIVFLAAQSHAQCTGTGTINFQRWNNITGSAPSSTGTRTTFEMQTNLGSNLGIRMYGYICPPTTGNYIFWIASDASGELWISTNSSPANKIRRAYNTSSTNSRQWNKFATQKSVAVPMVAGQLYYVEALMKESTGNDNLAVGCETGTRYRGTNGTR